MRAFHELDVTSIQDAIVLIDVDGTITSDSSETVAPEIIEVLKALTEKNRVYLCSNAKDKARIERLASATGAMVLDSPFRKPDARIIEGIKEREGKRMIVIGDKRLTDERFAKRIGAEFIPVFRITHEDDRQVVKATYLADDTYHKSHSLLRLMRPQQWIKNVIVFAPIFFAGTVFQPGILVAALLIFVAFSAAASCVYILNDIADREQDRLHETKRRRPIASGDISIGVALALALALVALVGALLFLVPMAAPSIIGYVLLSIVYSFFLKHIAIVDIVCVAFFYVLRILAGGYGTATYISPWIILCILFGALVLVIGKRRAEFGRSSRRAALEGYSKASLDYLLAMSATLAVVSYALYSAIGARSPLAIYSTVFVILAIFRIVNTLYSDDAEAEFPERLLFQDPVALVAGGLWTFYMFAILYV
jgi:decaprenyl-phosphate phosphoribosyltransferase